ncbi:hypothetical protein AAD001_11550 [Colwelliaceae bacterium 6471]
MNLFKKALIASAVVASFGASAATVSSTPEQLSAEGVSIGNTATVNPAIDVVVSTLHPAASTITLTFDSNVEFGAFAAAAGGVVTNNPGAGTGTSGDIVFSYGTGSFTFDNVVITDGVAADGELDTISFDVNLGNPITAQSAFRININGAGVVLSGAATVGYSSVDSLDAPIETGTGVIAEEVSQFSFGVGTPFNGVTERVNQVTFAKNGTTATSDTLVMQAINDETLSALVVGADLDISLEGNFDDGLSSLADGHFGATSQRTGIALVAAPDLDEVNDDDIALTVDNLEIGAGTADDNLTLLFTYAAGTIPVTGSIDATATFFAGTDEWEYTGDAGEWKLDATIINVPYFPVGFEGTSTSIHFANETGTATDVIVSAIDDSGNTYGPLDMGSDLAGETVTKVGQTSIMSLFGLTEATKLSVTFNIDADLGDVNAHAYTTSSAGRTEIATSQQNNDF